MNSSLADLQREAWAMEPRAAKAVMERIATSWPHLAQLEASSPAVVSAARLKANQAPALQVEGDTARIPVRGMLMKSVPWYFGLLDIEATSYGAIHAQIAEALSDESVESIMLDVESPGGLVAGVEEVGDAIFEARKQMDVSAHISDLGASAAYWLAS